MTVTVLVPLKISVMQQRGSVNVVPTRMVVNVISAERDSGISPTVNDVTAMAMPTLAILELEFV